MSTNSSYIWIFLFFVSSIAFTAALALYFSNPIEKRIHAKKINYAIFFLAWSILHTAILTSPPIDILFFIGLFPIYFLDDFIAFCNNAYLYLIKPKSVCIISIVVIFSLLNIIRYLVGNIFLNNNQNVQKTKKLHLISIVLIGVISFIVVGFNGIYICIQDFLQYLLSFLSPSQKNANGVRILYMIVFNSIFYLVCKYFFKLYHTLSEKY